MVFLWQWCVFPSGLLCVAAISRLPVVISASGGCVLVVAREPFWYQDPCLFLAAGGHLVALLECVLMLTVLV